MHNSDANVFNQTKIIREYKQAYIIAFFVVEKYAGAIRYLH